MTEPLLTISAFARAVDLAPSALRYYDEAGLLPPAEVDARTGYRYYTPELERRAHLIRRMREVGVPIETMRRVLDGTPEQAGQILQDLADRANDVARRTGEAVADVQAGLLAKHDDPRTVCATVDGPELATALRRIATAADPETDAPLNVVLIDLDGAELTVVATDRYWMATWSMPLSAAVPIGRRLVVPLAEVASTAAWLARRGTVTLSCTATEARLSADGGELALETVPDRFPAYRMLTATETSRGRVTVDRAALCEALGEQEAAVLLRVTADRLTVRPPDAAEGVRLPGTVLGEPIGLGFSPALLSKALTALVGQDASLAYEAPDRPVRVTSPDQRSLTALVMPWKPEPPA